MDPFSPKTIRQVAIADRFWEAFEKMAQTMGSDRDALINQAMLSFARANGFLESSAAPPESASPLELLPKEPAVPSSEWSTRQLLGMGAPPQKKEDPTRRQVADRVMERAAELERLMQSRTGREPIHQPVLSPRPLPNRPQPQPEATTLYLITDNGEMQKIGKDRFLIGRGKHCDFVINSGKVSREHAAIQHRGSEYFIEDLGSSNGTWFDQQRIDRRRVADGDEYLICSDKIRFVIR